MASPGSTADGPRSGLAGEHICHKLFYQPRRTRAQVVTVNDYLARRDSEWVGQVHRFLGLQVGLVQTGLAEAERKAAYGSDVTYVTNSELGFDYLRDNLAQVRFWGSRAVCLTGSPCVGNGTSACVPPGLSWACDHLRSSLAQWHVLRSRPQSDRPSQETCLHAHMLWPPAQRALL